MTDDAQPKFSRRRLKSDRTDRLSKRELSAKEAEMARELKEIYQNSDGSMPDMRHFERRRRRGVFRASGTLVLACLCLLGVVWVIVTGSPSNTGFSEEDVIVTVTGPEQVILGGDAAYDITYENREPMPLHSVVVHARYPAGFLFASSSLAATNASHDEWVIGDVASHGSATIHVTGQLYGDLGQAQSLRAFVTYTPDNFHSEFQKDANVISTIGDTPVTLVIGAPASATVGSTGDVTVTLQPKSDASPTNLSLSIPPVDGFVVKSMTPAPDKNAVQTWTFPTLGSDNHVTLHGIFVGAPDTDHIDMNVVVRGHAADQKTGDAYVYATATTTVALVQTTMSVSVAMNGTVDDTTIHPGDMLTGSVVVRNSGTTAQNNVVVRAILDTPSVNRQSVLKWSAIDDPADGTVSGEQLNPQLRRGIIVWDATKVPDLKKIDPGKSVTIDFRLPVKTTQDIDFGGTSVGAVTVSADVQFGKGSDQQILSANPVTMTLLSDARLEVRDEPGTTSQGNERHAITWVLTNSLHDLASTTLSADVYGDVSIDPKSISAAIGSALFDPDKKKLTWLIDRMPASLDTAALQFTAVMNSKNPTQTQLMSKVTGHATDVPAHEDIPLVGDEVMLQK